MKNITLILITLIITVALGFMAYINANSTSNTTHNSKPSDNTPSLSVIPTDSQRTYPNGWVQFRSDSIGVSLYHPQEMNLTEMEAGLVRLLITGPSQVMGTEMYDGLLVTLFKDRYESGSLRDFVERETEQKKTDPVYIEVSNIEEVKIGNKVAYAVTESTLGEFTQMYLPAGPNEYIQLTYLMEDPTNQGYAQILDTLLESIEFESTE